MTVTDLESIPLKSAPPIEEGGVVYDEFFMSLLLHMSDSPSPTDLPLETVRESEEELELNAKYRRDLWRVVSHPDYRRELDAISAAPYSVIDYLGAHITMVSSLVVDLRNPEDAAICAKAIEEGQL